MKINRIYFILKRDTFYIIKGQRKRGEGREEGEKGDVLSKKCGAQVEHNKLPIFRRKYCLSVTKYCLSVQFIVYSIWTKYCLSVHYIVYSIWTKYCLSVQNIVYLCKILSICTKHCLSVQNIVYLYKYCPSLQNIVCLYKILSVCTKYCLSLKYCYHVQNIDFLYDISSIRLIQEKCKQDIKMTYQKLEMLKNLQKLEVTTKNVEIFSCVF